MAPGVYRATRGKQSLMATSDQARAARTWRLAATGLAVGAVLAACGSSAGGMDGSAAGPSTAAAGSAACPHLTSLRASLISLTRLQASPAAINQMGADLGNIERQMTSLKDVGGSAGAREADELTAALRKITLAAQAEIGGPTPAHLAAVQSALTGMKDTAQPIIGQLKAACPGS
jgi:hypothetical protein